MLYQKYDLAILTCRAQSERFGTRIFSETVTKVDMSRRPFMVYTDEKEVEADTLIIATGATCILSNASLMFSSLLTWGNEIRCGGQAVGLPWRGGRQGGFLEQGHICLCCLRWRRPNVQE